MGSGLNLRLDAQKLDAVPFAPCAHTGTSSAQTSEFIELLGRIVCSHIEVIDT